MYTMSDGGLKGDVLDLFAAFSTLRNQFDWNNESY